MNSKPKSFRLKLKEIIFEADTKAGRIFDIVLIICILISVLVVMLESVASYRAQYGHIFRVLEWIFTILFTIEYLLRLYCILHPTKYAFSFFGIIDLLSVIPTYIDFFFPGTHYMAVLRFFRVLRVFRILKLVKFISEINLLSHALYSSRRKIFVFLFTLFTLVVSMGSIMYVVEGEENGFTSIPRSIYWAIVTVTTVGYGDIAPKTNLGQIFASIAMIMGYAIIAVPTGIVTAELTQSVTNANNTATKTCIQCGTENHDFDANYCKHCGTNFESAEKFLDGYDQ